MLLILGSSGRAKYTFYDLNSHKYAEPCYAFLKQHFSIADMTFVPGDSRETLRAARDSGKQFDLFHLDGGHAEEIYRADIENVLPMMKPSGIIIIDDTNIPYISNHIDQLIAEGKVIEIACKPTYLYQHRIVKKL